LSEHSLHEFKFFHLHGIEKSDRMVRIAMTDMMLHDDGHTNIRNQDALLSFDNYPDITFFSITDRYVIYFIAHMSFITISGISRQT